MESSSNAVRYASVSVLALACSVVWIIGATVLLRADARTGVLMLSSAVVAYLGSMAGLVWVLGNLRPDETALERFKHESDHDTLTGLPNQRSLEPLLEQTMNSVRRSNSILGVLFIDVDRFKNINDSMGHKAGDELLALIAERITAAVRSTDIVARFGGDEFVVLCPDLISERSVSDVAEQILRSFEKTFEVQSSSQKMSASIGVTTFDADDKRAGTELLRDSDLAMYAAKRTELRYAVFNDQHRHEILERQEIEQDLIQAISQKQFSVVYQPLVDLSTGAIYAFEALVRWNHPTKGRIMPSAFIPVAEDSGLIGEIGNFVMREACAQAAVWNHLNSEAEQIYMSINLAEKQLVDENLPKFVEETLRWAGLDASQLILEITEDVVVEHLDGLDSLRKLRTLGVSLAVDDFGTGQSSLSYLKQFDMVSTLKVDQSFIRDIDTDRADRAIVGAIVSMAEALGLKVVVEGVETEEQLKILTAMGVTIVQGYLFSKPVEPPEGDPSAWFRSIPWASSPMRALDVSYDLLAKARTSLSPDSLEL